MPAISHNTKAWSTASPWILLGAIALMILILALHPGDHTEGYGALGALATTLITRVLTFGASTPPGPAQSSTPKGPIMTAPKPDVTTTGTAPETIAQEIEAAITSSGETVIRDYLDAKFGATVSAEGQKLMHDAVSLAAAPSLGAALPMLPDLFALVAGLTSSAPAPVPAEPVS